MKRLSPRPASMTIPWPAEIVIYVPTQGASVGYTTEDGPMTLRAKAIRYGYKESAETRVVFTKQ